MKFTSSFIKIASIPPWAKIHFLNDGSRNIAGYWTQNQAGHYLFVDEKTNKVWLPKALRGRSLDEINLDELESLPKEDLGKTHYNLWKEDFDKQKNLEKIFNGFQFTPLGTELIERLKKYVIKNKFDRVEELGLDGKYSIKPESFDKLNSFTNSDKIKVLGRNIAKKIRMIMELLRTTNPKLVKRIEPDFYYHWNKLQPLFDFDPAKYKPELADKEDENSPQEDLITLSNHALSEVQTLLDPQMGEVVTVLNNLQKSINEGNIPVAQKDYEQFASILMKYIGRMHQHPMGIAAEKILQLPSIILLHHKLFENAK